MTGPIYAIGDIHGQRDALDATLQRIEADGGPDAKIVFLGDYVDRGPDSRGVLDLLANGLADGRNWVPLLGNHDRMMRLFLEDPPQGDPHLLVGFTWFHPRIGGTETLASYGIGAKPDRRVTQIHKDACARVPERHRALLDRLATTHTHGDLLFVHAGLRPGVPLARQTEEDLVWIRGEFHDHTAPFSHLVVHGHTPVDRPTHYGNRVNLDTGAGYGKPLTAAVFEGGEAFVLGPSGRRPLRP